MESINPATGKTVKIYREMTSEEAAAVVDRADTAFRRWKNMPYVERSRYMRVAADTLRRREEEFARLMALEMGKPVRLGRAEVEKCAWLCEYYAEHAEFFLMDESVQTEASRSFITFRPLGVVLAVMPWNFPFWQVLRFAVPAIMAGNGCVLKHASNVTGCALAVEELFREAGFPDHLFGTVLVGARRVGELIAHPKIAAVTLTGSTSAGRDVAERAGREIKKTVLELGGSDPYLILADADLDSAVTTCVTSRLINSGQSCIAAKRFIVVDAVRANFEELFARRMREKRYGDPLDEETEVGPLARHDLREELHRQVSESVRTGARCLLGGVMPRGDGAFYPPTVLTQVRPGMPAFDEELFGPVAAIVPASGEEQAIELANASTYGLGAAIFTADEKRGERLATYELEAGCCFVNDFVRSDPRLPFGGIKASGYGRELSKYGIREFANIKSVYVR